MDLLLDERSLPTPDAFDDVSGPAFGEGHGVARWLLAVDRWATNAAGPRTGRPPSGRPRLPA